MFDDAPVAPRPFLEPSLPPITVEGLAAQTVGTSVLASVVSALSRLDEQIGDAERIDQIRLLEELKSAAAAAQARVTADFVASQTTAEIDAGAVARDRGKGIAAQVALAKRESPARARRYIGWAGVLVAELPRTFAALQTGQITEWRAQIVARETAWLDRVHRQRLDKELAPSLETLGDRQIEAVAKTLAYRLDPHGFMARIRGVHADRRVSLRPAPDTMSLLSGLLPVTQGVAVFASLQEHAAAMRAQGDERSRGQIMADTLVERVTGQATAEAVPVEVNLVMTDQALFNTGAGADEPANVQGFGPIPAALARRLVVAAEDAVTSWVRRLYACPTSGELVAMDSRRRLFGGGLSKFLVLRDQICRTPWCDAPIRHLDHVVPVESGGDTSAANGQGLCEACNHAKQAAGWSSRPSDEGAGICVEVTTPTGHRYSSRCPSPPGRRHPDSRRGHLLSPVELHLGNICTAA